MNNFFRLTKNNILKKAMVMWRKNSYADCVKTMIEMEENYESTLNSNDQRMSNIIAAKHNRATRIINLKKMR